MKTMYQYLEENRKRNIIDHAIRVEKHKNGLLSFCIHPVNAEGDTLDFTVTEGNTLVPLERGTPLSDALIEAGEL